MAEVEVKLSLKKAMKLRRQIIKNNPKLKGKVIVEQTIPIRRKLSKLRGQVNTLVNKNSFTGPRFDKQAAKFTQPLKKPTD